MRFSISLTVLLLVYTIEPRVIKQRKPTVCQSNECLDLAAQLRNWHDPRIDPCVNFYKFTCGNYMKHTVVDGTRTEKKNRIIDRLFDDYLDNETPTTKSEKALKTLYQKCRNLKDEENFDLNLSTGLEDIYKDIGKIGYWPTADSEWTEDELDLNAMLTNLAKLGVVEYGLFKIGIPGAHLLEVAPGRMEPSEDLKEVISKILEANGIEFDENVLDEDLENYKNFHEELEKHVYGLEDNQLSKLSEMEPHIPSIDFGRVIEELKRSTSRIVLDNIENKLVAYKYSLFFDTEYNLEKLIQDTPSRTLANFLIFHYIDLSSDSLSIDFDTVEARECSQIVRTKLPLPSLRVYAKRHVNSKNVGIVSKMTEEIRTAFIDMIYESKWLHDDTAERAILKLEKMKKLIGYSESLMKPGAMDKTTKLPSFSASDSYYTMIRKINRYLAEQSMDYVAWNYSMNPLEDHLEVNAYYKKMNNDLRLNVPFLEAPFFHSTYPKYVNIAVTGFTLAHEMGHGFDDTGRFRDENGDNYDWWTEEDSMEYEQRAQCLVDQYNDYNDPDFGKKLNGSNVLSELIADTLGAQAALRAFETLDLSEQPKIVGFEKHSIERLYFRIAAAENCEYRNTSPVEDHTHPTSSFRVNGPFSNMKQFAIAYNCPLGSPMNPRRKCEMF